MDVVTTIGVDAHCQVHMAAAVDPQGRVIAERAITANTQQLAEFVGWCKACGRRVRSRSRARKATAAYSASSCWQLEKL